MDNEKPQETASTGAGVAMAAAGIVKADLAPKGEAASVVPANDPSWNEAPAASSVAGEASESLTAATPLATSGVEAPAASVPPSVEDTGMGTWPETASTSAPTVAPTESTQLGGGFLSGAGGALGVETAPLTTDLTSPVNNVLTNTDSAGISNPTTIVGSTSGQNPTQK